MWLDGRIPITLGDNELSHPQDRSDFPCSLRVQDSKTPPCIRVAFPKSKTPYQF